MIKPNYFSGSPSGSCRRDFHSTINTIHTPHFVVNILMRPKLQKQSALKLVGRIIPPQLALGYILVIDIQEQISYSSTMQGRYFIKNIKFLSILIIH